MHAALDAAYDDNEVAAVVEAIVARIEPAGRSNALAAKLLALTLPGVPDVYQGSELERPQPGRPGQPATGRLRRCAVFTRATAPSRSSRSPPRRCGSDATDPSCSRRTTPLPAEGPAADHVLAFDRGGAITVVTRLPLGLEAKGGWGDTVAASLPDGPARVGEILSDRAATVVVRPMSRGRFDVWAPYPKRVRLSVGDEVVEMTRGADDWWSPVGPVPEGEVDYGYLLDDSEQVLPDPRSRRQPARRARAVADLRPDRVRVDRRALDRPPAGRLGRSTSCTSAPSPPRARSTRPSRSSTTSSRSASTWSSCCRSTRSTAPTTGGTTACCGRPSTRQYGGPAAYQRFVDAAHAAGLGVVQDVVYNHLGPSGNYLPLFGPYLKSRGREHLGLAGQPRRRRGRRRYAATSSTAP